jgi:uncharacterized membrane protein YhhN
MKPIFHLIFGLTALVALLWATARQSKTGIWLAKPLASLAFVTAAMGAATHASYYGERVVWAASLGAVGDVLLLRSGRWPFVAALVAFIVGHGLYIDAFLHQGFDARILGFALLVLLVPAGLIQAYLRPTLPQALTLPVYAYLLVISLLVASATAASRFAVAPTLQVLGACLFYASDIFVARDAFVKTEPRNSLLGLPLYYAAQWLLVASLGIF